MAMLKHNDRVCGINLRVLSSPLSENIHDSDAGAIPDTDKSQTLLR